MINSVRSIILLLAFLVSGILCGQTLIVEINPIGQVPVGGAFTVSGTVSHDPASPTIPAGTSVDISIQVADPSGNPVFLTPPIQDFAGFNAGRALPFAQTFTMPWTEDEKWSAGANWVASVTAASSVSSIVRDNEPFALLIADLQILSTQNLTARAGEYVDITGIIRNQPNVQTEPGTYFQIAASTPLIPNQAGTTHTIVFPPPGSWTAGNPWPIGASTDNDFSFTSFRIPPDTPAGPYGIVLSVDGPDSIHEQDDLANNTFTHTITIVDGVANLQATSNFLINGDLEGTFQGRDSVRCTITIRNVGTGPVLAADNFDLRVLLSNDLSVSNSDFLLREIDLGGGSIGLGLLPNETITLDWVQMLPDNFEGDFYVISELNGVLLASSTTPSLSLRSENSLDLEMESPANVTHHHSRPSSSLDGMIMVHESLANGLTQIQLLNKSSGATTNITQAVGGGNPDGSSFAPVLSSSGKFVVFHSHATNLVPDDTNGHVDVFRYEVFNGRLTRLSIDESGEGGNGGSFYPSISNDGDRVVFESHAFNLDSNQSVNGKQIFLWTEKVGTYSGTGTVSVITQGNADSFDASMSGDGSLIVFTTFADDLVVGETDTNNNSDVVLWENGQFYYAGRGEDGSLPANGATKEAVISKDGKVISFVSSARNMVSQKGIAHILIEDSGVGYSLGSRVMITDANGTGASVTISNLNPYGEILGFSIDNPGKNYINPRLNVVTPGGMVLPDRNVSALPLLVNPEGDIFRINVTDLKVRGPSQRLSESPALDGDQGSETGGNLGSREPSISHDGNSISYSSRASNLLDLNVSSTNNQSFANHSFRSSMVGAVLHWGIGSVVIINQGLGYLGTGNIVIEDLSGSGSGAVATYQVLSNGGVGQITLVNAGSGYDLNQTTISIQNDPTGSGFIATAEGLPATGLAENRIGGASIHRIEVMDAGTGYPPNLNKLLQAPEIIIDGDGADLDQDGKTDARLNPDRLYSGTNGEIYIEQQIDLTILNRASLAGSTLIVGDLNQSHTIEFTPSPTPTLAGQLSIGVDFSDSGRTIPQTDSGLRDDIATSIRNFWGSPTSLFNGPLIENNVTAGSGFTLRVLNGFVQIDNPSALRATYKSNMLVGGSGYTRATPFVSPAPVVMGYSEIATGSSSIISPSGRPIFDFQEDLQTDDIYHFDYTSKRNQRVSLSKFGYPTNYLSATTLPSHRYPSISGDGRYVFFSSDATGLGGLIFGNSNQTALDRNQTRSVYSIDLKSDQLPQNNNDYSISISPNLLSVTASKLYLSRPFPIMVEASSSKGSLNNIRLYVDGVQAGNNAVGVQGSRNHKTFFSWTPSRQGTHEIIASVINNIGEEIFSSPVTAEVISPTSTTAMGNLSIQPNGSFNQTTQGSSLLGSVEFTGSNGKKAIVASVAFYLNDQLLSTQYDPPFSTVFSPPAYDGNSSLSRWSFTALAQDLNGSTVVTSRFGQIQGSSVLPTLILKPINTLSGMSDNEVFDKQRVTLEASVQGESDTLALVQAVRFYANGFLLDGNGTGVPIITSSGQIKSIEYKIDWDVDFARYAKPDGTVEIIALGEMNPTGGFTPVFPSPSLVVRVSPPTPWLNEKSTALSIFSDLSDSNMSTRQVEALLEKINSGDDGVLESWANDLSEVASFQQKMSVIAARHICMGEWHDSFLDLETDFNTWIPTGAVNTSWLKNYIDSVLFSDQYIAKYGVVPLLVGYENEKDIHDFDLNRRAFAERSLTNKYGNPPNFQQMFQGSKRMANYWNSLSGGNYWELRNGGGGVGANIFFSPPRLDSLTTNAYQAGECAVDFVQKLTEEVPIDNLSYILYTGPLRNSIYKVATFTQLLWRENADPVQDSDIKRLSAMPINDAIKSILNDYRYTSRFNLIWKDSTVIDANTPSWKNEDWFGYFWDKHFPWVYHSQYEWIYIAGVSPTQFWFHHAGLGWLWTGAAYYKGGYVYSNTLQEWIYLSPENKTYYSQVSKSWVSYSD